MSDEPRTTTATLVRFDATGEFPDLDEFERICGHYWVLAFRGEQTRLDWLMSAGRPLDVPNGSMVWRRPTYQEFLAWKDWWSKHDEPPADLVKYARPPHDIPQCVCGHGADAHQQMSFTPLTCRMSCHCMAPHQNGSQGMDQ